MMAQAYNQSSCEVKARRSQVLDQPGLQTLIQTQYLSPASLLPPPFLPLILSVPSHYNYYYYSNIKLHLGF